MSTENDGEDTNKNLEALHESSTKWRNRAKDKLGLALIMMVIAAGDVDFILSADSDRRIKITSGILGFAALVATVRLSNGVLKDMDRYSARNEDIAVIEYRLSQSTETDTSSD